MGGSPRHAATTKPKRTRFNKYEGKLPWFPGSLFFLQHGAREAGARVGRKKRDLGHEVGGSIVHLARHHGIYLSYMIKNRNFVNGDLIY